jgi:NADH:ubiquinone oxidoreductase subunit 3 (subunit A)
MVFSGSSVSSTNKTEIMLKVALNTITQTNKQTNQSLFIYSLGSIKFIVFDLKIFNIFPLGILNKYSAVVAILDFQETHKKI